ncbi:hypothetical protein EVAR_74844_1 [Eumeta japonica]|uniref:Uncharacterized protein n=1 Tax=Eumeta variegata TaxID=151549 RepID=A0A4C1SSS8_EUMVA|nr:hypothetical protein EVAR_74844_1 [Eumeta japonica]
MRLKAAYENSTNDFLAARPLPAYRCGGTTLAAAAVGIATATTDNYRRRLRAGTGATMASSGRETLNDALSIWLVVVAGAKGDNS